MLGVGPSAYQEACEVMAPENAAVAVAAILERAGYINSAGGYLRNLTKRAAVGEFSLGPVIMSLLSANSENDKRSTGLRADVNVEVRSATGCLSDSQTIVSR